MSIIHVGHIKTHVKRVFDTHIDLKDAQSAPVERQEDPQRTGELIALARRFTVIRPSSRSSVIGTGATSRTP
jgi:hypothetical protein